MSAHVLHFASSLNSSELARPRISKAPTLPKFTHNVQFRDESKAKRRSVAAHGVVPVAERNGWWLKRPQPNLHDINNLSELVSFLEQNTDRLVIIEFFAPWCASCKALYPKLSKICGENPQIVCGKINFDENREMARAMGVKVLPFIHAYHGSMGRVAAFSCTVTRIQRLRDCISLFGHPYCDLEGSIDISKSLPEFEQLPAPCDATVLKFSQSGHEDGAEEKVDSPAAVTADLVR